MNIIIQLNEQGNFAVQEQKDELNKAFKKFAGTEIEVVVKEVNEFTTLLETSIKLQNKFSEMTNESAKRWTNEEFAALRGKMSSCYYHLIDDFATAKSNEKMALSEKEICLETLRAKLINDNSPSVSTTKAKATQDYKDVSEKYLESYKIRSLLELHLKSLDTSMNAIAGISKHDVNKLKF